MKLINRVLADLQGVLKKEPEYKFLELLDDDELPQTSDAVLIMVQYESALQSFSNRYYRRVKDTVNHNSRYVWLIEGITLEKNEVFDV